jgi:hypothetical protein
MSFASQYTGSRYYQAGAYPQNPAGYPLSQYTPNPQHNYASVAFNPFTNLSNSSNQYPSITSLKSFKGNSTSFTHSDIHKFFYNNGVEDSRIINPDRDILDSVRCTACAKMMWDPVACDSCSHNYCKSCLLLMKEKEYPLFDWWFSYKK